MIDISRQLAYGIRHGGVYAIEDRPDASERESLVVKAYNERKIGVHLHIGVVTGQPDLGGYCVVFEAANGTDSVDDGRGGNMHDRTWIVGRERAVAEGTRYDGYEP